ncbi:MAG TPA: CARDB domain-containing protein [Candidatus Acidoferrum sp.]|nr:CARDB domain-containing protein [Candidatus Acidoferrum sp.]
MHVFAAANFKALPFTDPFPQATTPGVMAYSQPASTVILSENNLSTLPITRQPVGMSSGFGAITIEWWMKQKPGSGSITSNPHGTIVHGPGFAVNADWQWGGGPGSIVINLSQNKGGQYAGNRGAVIPLPYSDEQWHHYVVTYDLRTVRTYFDGELLEQKWLDNNADRLGPYEDDSFTIKSSVIEIGGGVTTSGSRFQNGFLEAARVSTVAITPWQVKRNFENTKNYATTLFVASSGSGNGTQGSPMSLSSALAQVGGNTRIILQEGTYNGNDFQVTRSGASPRNNCLIIGADGSTPAIISGGSPALSGAGWITLRNITFSSDGGTALQINSASKQVTVDGCRFSGNGRGLSVNSSPKILVQNCVANAGTGLYFNNSADAVVRHNTIVNGSVGAQFDANSVRLSFLNNLMSGQASACLSINGSQAFYRGNGNLYHPAGATAVSIDGANYSAAQVNNRALANTWYNLDVADVADSRQRRTGYAAEAQSMSFAPTFVDAANGDFRLASVQANAIDAGVEKTFQHAQVGDESKRRGTIPTVTDAMGAPRPQGNAPDVGAYETVPLRYAVFNLDADYTCSAGVYKNDETLVRTLFSGQRKAQGTNVVFWNGLDDSKQPVANDTYTIKMIAHNVQYVWEGVVGNSSSPNANSSVHGGFEPIWGMAIYGTTVFYTSAYNENKYELYRFDTSNPNKVTKSFGPIHNIYSDAATDLATDGNKLYALNSAQIAVYNFNDCSAGSFNDGQHKKNAAGSGRGWIEVQRNGNLLFVSRPNQNAIYIYDKNSGNQTGTISVNQPKDLALTASGDLWAISGNTAVRFVVNSGGGNAVQTISGFGNPVNIACSPADGSIIVADASTHQVKAFSANGATIWTHGNPNSYAGDPRVTSDKFYFLHVDQGRYTYMAPLAFQQDGSFWVCDTFLSRAIRFNASRQVTSEISYQPHSYNASVDLNNPKRVFNRFTEYAVDYTKPLAQGWVMTNFWGYNLPGHYYGFEDGVCKVVTLNNGRTYATAYDGGAGSSRQIVEITANGLRETGTRGLNVYAKIEKDGSMLTYSFGGGTVTFQRKPLSGFDGSGNPTWGPPAALGSAPVGNSSFASDPFSVAAFNYGYPQMASNLVISYDADRTRSGFHLGAVKPGTSQWLWKAMPSAGGLDGQGTFDSWCEWGGNHVMTSGRNIMAGFHGEFWNDIGQANQFFHYYDNGLFVGQFGSPMVNGVSINGPGASGNSFSPALVEVGSDVYLYHNDEWSRGSHRWKPVGINDIRELTSAISQGQAPVGTNQPPDGGTNTNTVNGTDLIVSAIGMAQANLQSGQSVYFTATIKNQGNTAGALATYGCSFFLDGVKVTWWYEGDSSLAPGQSRDVVAFDGPNGNLGAWLATEGAHTLVACVDDMNRVAESNEGNNTITTTFTVGTGGTVPTLTVTASAPNAAEAGANGSFTITRSGSTSAALTVNYTLGGTAANGIDFQTLATSATIPAGAASTVVTVAVLDDLDSEPAEDVVLTIAGSANYTVGVLSTATVTIFDYGNTPGAKVTIHPAGAGKIALTWPTVSGGVYTVAYKSSLTDSTWTPLSTGLTGTGTSFSYTDAPPANVPMRLYKVTKNP